MTKLPAAKPNYTVELALLVALATLWGASYTFIKIGIETIPPITLIAARTLLAGFVLWVVMLMRGVQLPRDRASWGRFLVQSCLNSVIPFTLIAWAEQSIDAGVAVILNSMTPVFTFLITLLWSRHEATSPRRFAGILLGMAGTIFIVGMQATQHIGQELAAQLAVVLATICYAGAAIFGRSFKDMDPMAPAAGSLICGAAMLIPVSLDRRSAVDSVALHRIGSRLDRARHLLDRDRVRDLFPADPDPRLAQYDRPGLFTRSHRGRNRCALSGRKARSLRLHRTDPDSRRCRVDDPSRSKACSGRAGAGLTRRRARLKAEPSDQTRADPLIAEQAWRASQGKPALA